jgi:hypothetical protein
MASLPSVSFGTDVTTVEFNAKPILDAMEADIQILGLARNVLAVAVPQNGSVGSPERLKDYQNESWLSK